MKKSISRPITNKVSQGRANFKTFFRLRKAPLRLCAELTRIKVLINKSSINLTQSHPYICHDHKITALRIRYTFVSRIHAPSLKVGREKLVIQMLLLPSEPGKTIRLSKSQRKKAMYFPKKGVQILVLHEITIIDFNIEKEITF